MEKKQFAPLSKIEDRIARAIVASAFNVHSALGPGLLENIYEVCFCHELKKAGYTVRRQVVVPLVYDGLEFAEGLRLDVLVNDLVICELKSVEEMKPVFTAQIMTQMKLTKKRLGFLINFNVPLIKNGIRRFII